MPVSSRGRRIAGLLLFLAATAGGVAQATSAPYALINAFPNLRFNQPVDLRPAPDGRLFVVEREGRLRRFENRVNASSAPVFLDISGQVSTNGEGGLLGLAFHPQYAKNRQLFLYYTLQSPRRIRISRFTASADRSHADPGSEVVILEVKYPQQYGNHNAGSMAFGPVDGKLYLGMGDGGGAGDPFGNGQNRKVLLGKILRIDVDHPSGKFQYGIPVGNPLAGNTQGFRQEIYAWGMRNPWRISFDMPAKNTQQLWVADVGQDEVEEVDIVEAGKNYGWNIAEGSRCYSPRYGCNMAGLAKPVAEYRHDVGQSITGGYVYRGRRLPGLTGRYLYADFISGRIWALRYGPGMSKAVEIAKFPRTGIASFGMDAAGEIYLLDLVEGQMLTLQRADAR